MRISCPPPPEELQAMLGLIEDLPKSQVRWYVSWATQGRSVSFRPAEIIRLMQTDSREAQKERETNDSK